MAVSLLVKYGEGGKPLEPIRDEMLVTESMALRRGLKALDDVYWTRARRRVRIAFRDIRVGQIISLADVTRPRGEKYYVRSVRTVVEAPSRKVTQELELEGAFEEP